MGLLVTLLLVLVNLFGTVITNGPPTSQPTMLDIWMLICLIFAWDALLAYAALLLHQRYQMGREAWTLHQGEGEYGSPNLWEAAHHEMKLLE